jgi:hypothetical protein
MGPNTAFLRFLLKTQFSSLEMGGQTHPRSLEILLFLTYSQINVRIPRTIDTAKRYVSLEWKRKHFSMLEKSKILSLGLYINYFILVCVFNLCMYCCYSNIH